jgi:hypothetical protein
MPAELRSAQQAEACCHRAQAEACLPHADIQLSLNLNLIVTSATYNRHRYPKTGKEETEYDALLSLSLDGGITGG